MTEGGPCRRPWAGFVSLFPRALLAFCALAMLASVPARAQQPAAAAAPPLAIAVFVSSRADVCYDPGDVGAITTLVTREAARINRKGGIAGRRLDVRILDDGADQGRAIAAMRTALADPSTIAMIGMSNSTRSKAVFDAVGPEIRTSGIPFISNIAVNSIFAGTPNVLTTQVSQDEERLPVMIEFIRRMGLSRVAFVGLKDAVFSTAFGDGLRKRLGDGAIVLDRRLAASENGLDQAEVAKAAAEIAEKRPDVVVLAVGGRRASALVKALVTGGSAPALFVTGRIETLPAEVVSKYPNAIYQLAWDRLPEADNDRLRQLIARDAPEGWVFEGRKMASASGWAKGQCKERPKVEVADPFTSANQRAIGIGAQFADMVALVAEAARGANVATTVADLRARVLDQITTTFAAGRGIFKGSFENWSFHPASRTAQRTPFVVIRPQGLGRTQLAPVQFVRLKDGALREIETLYVDIDLIRAHRVDDNEKTFAAEFYLSLRGENGASIDQIEFTNAFLDPKTNGRQITIEVLHGGGASPIFPPAMKVYKVAGRFTFEPDLASYPFDTQRFAINVQPKRADRPFVVQPPPPELRDQDVATDGWDLKTQYVGYSEDFVPLLDPYRHEPSVVPFYRASFVWLMKRQTTDYYLRVVVPLGFILIVAYLSYFISTSHFEAIVTIQVTALLSAVALYLSLPKLDTDTATLSDRIFVFNYMMVSLMIAISILRVNRLVIGRRVPTAALTVVHVLLIPVLMAAMAVYVWSVSLM